jgi:hypothetical protein
VGRWGLFLKAAKSCRIPWNGSGALKFSTGQPQRKARLRKDTFPACPVEFPDLPPRASRGRRVALAQASQAGENPIQQGLSCASWFGVGGVPQTLKNLCCGLLKETPTAFIALFQNLKLVQNTIFIIFKL